MFEGYFSHRGRIGRLRLLKLNVINILALVLLAAMIYLLYRLTEGPFVLIFLILGLPVVYSNLMLCIKRLHDLNLSGWWILLLTVIGIILDLIDKTHMLKFLFSVGQFALLCLARGTDGPNRFGDKPSGPGTAPSDSSNAPTLGVPA